MSLALAKIGADMRAEWCAAVRDGEGFRFYVQRWADNLVSVHCLGYGQQLERGCYESEADDVLAELRHEMFLRWINRKADLVRFGALVHIRVLFDDAFAFVPREIEPLDLEATG